MTASITFCDRRVVDGEYNSSSEFYFSIRWSSPESLTLKKFSNKSDVWSFGIIVIVIGIKFTKLASLIKLFLFERSPHVGSV